MPYLFPQNGPGSGGATLLTGPRGGSIAQPPMGATSLLTAAFPTREGKEGSTPIRPSVEALYDPFEEFKFLVNQALLLGIKPPKSPSQEDIEDFKMRASALAEERILKDTPNPVTIPGRVRWNI